MEKIIEKFKIKPKVGSLKKTYKIVEPLEWEKKSQITKFFVCHVPPCKILSKTGKCKRVKTPEFLCSFKWTM